MAEQSNGAPQTRPRMRSERSLTLKGRVRADSIVARSKCSTHRPDTYLQTASTISGFPLAVQRRIIHIRGMSGFPIRPFQYRRYHVRGCRSYLRKSPLSIRQYKYSVQSGGFSIPQVTIKTGFTTPDGGEEELTEYLCDYPECPNIATHVLGVLTELRLIAVACDEHAPKPPA